MNCSICSCFPAVFLSMRFWLHVQFAEAGFDLKDLFQISWNPSKFQSLSVWQSQP
jgi:hypothetical protein